MKNAKLLIWDFTGWKIEKAKPLSFLLIKSNFNWKKSNSSDEDLDELDQFIHDKLDVYTQNQLEELHTKKDNGEQIDEDRLYELELFGKRRSGDELNEDEMYEIDLFERRMLGEELQDDELDELDMLREERQQLLDEKYELEELRGCRDGGESYDEDLLYELEL